jgi:hypothetical protein
LVEHPGKLLGRRNYVNASNRRHNRRRSTTFWRLKAVLAYDVSMATPEGFAGKGSGIAASVTAQAFDDTNAN